MRNRDHIEAYGQVPAEYGPMRTVVTTVGLLVLSNLFMTIAWYGHLKNLASKPWYVAALVSWGVALFNT